MSLTGLKSKVFAGCVHSGCSLRENPFFFLPFLASRGCLHFSTSSKPAKWEQVFLMLPSLWFSLSLSLILCDYIGPNWMTQNDLPMLKSELTALSSICNLNSSLPYQLTYSQFLQMWIPLRGHSSTYHIQYLNNHELTLETKKIW